MQNIHTIMKQLNTATPSQHEDISYFYCKLLVTQLILPIMMVFDSGSGSSQQQDSPASDTATATISLNRSIRSSLFLAAIAISAAFAIFRYITFICITTISLSVLYQCRLYCNLINSHRHRKFFRRKLIEHQFSVHAASIPI